MDFQKEGKLKCQLLTALWVHILECLQTKMFADKYAIQWMVDFDGRFTEI